MGSVANEISPGRPPLSEAALCECLGRACPGNELEYYRGFLARDVSPEAGRLPQAERAELARVARRARWASDRGLVDLVQRRLGPELFAYIAVARHRPNGARASLEAPDLSCDNPVVAKALP